MLNRFKKLHIEDWQQFSGVDIDFHDRLTIITGANGSGKTTILNLLAKHCNWDIPLIALPKKDKKKGLFGWITGSDEPTVEQSNAKIGHIVYENNNIADMYRPLTSGAAQFNLQIQNQQQVDGFFIPSHRSVYSYQKLENLPTDISHLTKANAFQRVSNATRERYLGNGNQRVNYHIKEVLVSWSTFGYGNPTMEGQPYLLECFQGFEKALKMLLPESLGFNKILIQNFEVILDCDSGSFPIDSASGGLTAIIDMAWQIYMFNEDKDSPFTVIIDEVENHLHPTMQRRILNDLINAFPNITFIVSTHSPLIVSSVKDSNVYALRYRDKKVYSEQLDLVKNAKTAAEVLDDVLGVSSTLPIWAESALQDIVGSFTKESDVSSTSIKALEKSLNDAGLSEFVPNAIEEIAKKFEK